MDIIKEQRIDMYMKKIVFYSTYVDCLSRVINEFIENGDGNIMPCDVPNLMEFLAKISHRLHRNIIKMKSDWEFLN